MRYFILNLLLLISVGSLCQSKPIIVSGIIFEDTNGNGIKDKSEKGLRNVPVSNGKDIVLSDNKGKYILYAKVGDSVFGIPSSQYRHSSKRKNKNANFLYIDSSYSNIDKIEHDIALNKQEESEIFKVGVIGDIQMGNYQEINYANQSLMPELMLRNDIDFNIFLGDQINDSPELLPIVKQMTESLPMPSWSIFGNHDRLIDTLGLQDNAFNRNFGASHYAFNYGQIHFIVLNNIYSKDNNRNYIGYVNEDQLNFVKQDLQFVPKDKTIVLCQHIPMIFTQNKLSILELLKDRNKVLILSGHTHTVGRHMFAHNIQELVAGATCGNWWVGERDWLGIPTALMQCGTPRGYFTIDFLKDDYKIRFKGVGLDADRQMDIWIGGQDSIDMHVDELKAYGNNTVIANIYGASDSTKVMMKIDDRQWIEMVHTKIVAPSVSRLISLNRDNVYPTKHSRRGALRKRESPHIWITTFPSDLNPGIHTIRIKAEDGYGYSSDGVRSIYISE